ncbi:MAG TPA: CoA transferase [Dehalococcoidia bacterium]|nr:CoA transferase [Dehalococcoidia bacterium]
MSLKPLDGLTVLELGEGVAGALCGKFLRDYGAEVIKVEAPANGDTTRRVGPFPNDEPDSEKSALFLYLNAGKKSLTLDIDSDDGRDVIRRLVLEVEAIVETFPPGFLAASGLPFDDLRRRKPRLLMTSITPFGQTGPYSAFKSNNLVSFAMGGQMNMTGDPDREPLLTAGYQADYQAGLHAFAATCIGLYACNLQEIGQWIDISAQECQATMLEFALPWHMYLGVGMGNRRGNQINALAGVYPTADGYAGIHIMQPQWERFARLMDPTLLEDERFANMSARLANNDELMARVFAWMSQQKREELYHAGQAARVPVAFVHDVDDLLASEHLDARAFWHKVDHPAAGTATHPGPPIRFADVDADYEPVPLLGEHTEEILADIGVRGAEMAVLRERGVI